MKSLTSLIVFILVVGCGAKNPLSRGEDGPGGDGGFSEGFDKPSVADFERVVLPSLEKDCNMCHSNPAPDYDEALKFIEIGFPTKSKLYRTAVGTGHRKVWAPDRLEAEALARWILLEESAAY